MSDIFSFSDQEFINIINLMCKLDTTDSHEFKPITSMDDTLDFMGLDSLGIAIFFIGLSELFGISEDKTEEFTHKQDFTIKSIKAFVLAEANKSYEYINPNKLQPRSLLDKLSFK